MTAKRLGHSSLLFLSLWLSLGMVSSYSAGETALAAASPWPDQITQIGMNTNLNPVWGTAINSDISWTFDTKGDMPFTNVMVVDGLAYVGSMMNNIYALDAVTGRLVWQFEANNWIMTNPVVVDGKLFAGSGNREFAPGDKPGKGATRGTGPNSLYALDAKTGKVIWQYDVPGEAMPTPLYYEGVVYFITGDRNLYALNADNGTLLYKQHFDSVFSMGSINRDGDILILSGGSPFKVYGFNLKTRQTVWTTWLWQVGLGLDDSNPAIANGRLYVNGITYEADGSNPRHQFFALDTQTGKLRWQFDAGMFQIVDDNKSSTPAIVDGTYYGASSNSRQFFALDAATGALKWKYKVGVPVKGGPVVMNGFVFFADAKGNVYAMNAATGQLVGKKALGGNVNPQGPTLFNGTLYIANQNGKIYAMPVASMIKNPLQAAKPDPAQPGAQYFKETGQTLKGAFLNYWQTQGGLSQFGFPITPEIQEYHAAEGRTYTVQYFERVRMELHDNDQVLLGRMGSEVTSRTNAGASPAFKPVTSAPVGADLYKETGHTLSGDFRTFWQANGGLARYGFPISEPFQTKSTTGQTITAQYFERTRLELHSLPGGGTIVLQGLLGREELTAL